MPARSAAAPMRSPNLSDEARARGVCDDQRRQCGAGVAYSARSFGVTVHRPSRWKPHLTPSSTACARSAQRSCPSPTIRPGSPRGTQGLESTFIHPFNNDDFIAGPAHHGAGNSRRLPGGAHGEVSAIGGGGLITARRRRDQGAASPRRQCLAPSRKLRRLSNYGFVKGGRENLPLGRLRSSTGPAARASRRACGSECGRSPTGRSPWALDQTRKAIGLIAENTRAVAEGAGALSLAAAPTARFGEGPTGVVSGGNIDLAKLAGAGDGVTVG